MKLFESIFIMDLDVSTSKFLPIDNQLMIKEVVNPMEGTYKIKSSFSFASTILKETLQKIFIDRDFFNKRIDVKVLDKKRLIVDSKF